MQSNDAPSDFLKNSIKAVQPILEILKWLVYIYELSYSHTYMSYISDQ